MGIDEPPAESLTDPNLAMRDRLTALLDDCAPSISAAEQATIRDFIDVHEFGVALDWLVGYLAENRARVTAGVRAEITELAKHMKMTGEISPELRQLAPERE